MKIWSCKVGEVPEELVPRGADGPMRKAVEAAFKQVTGQDPEFCFSGWGAELIEGERAVVEDRLPDYMPVFILKGQDRLALAAILDAQVLVVLHAQAQEVQKAMEKMTLWQEDNPQRMKLPDHRNNSVTGMPMVPDGEPCPPHVHQHEDGQVGGQ